MPSEAELGEEKKMGKRVKYIHIHKKKKRIGQTWTLRVRQPASQPAAAPAATDLAKTGLKNPTKASGPQETDSHWKTGGGETHDRRPKD